MRYALLLGLLATAAQLVPAAVTLHLLLPNDRRCEECDGETLLVHPGALGYAFSLLAFGGLQRRWCLQCGREGFARGPGPIRRRFLAVRAPREAPPR